MFRAMGFLHIYYLFKGGFIMYTYLKFLSQRYLGQKGQGIVEYAVIVAVVVAVGVALTGSSSFQTGITDRQNRYGYPRI